jgi:hypothetical protein
MKPQLQVSCVDYHFQITSFPVSLWLPSPKLIIENIWNSVF